MGFATTNPNFFARELEWPEVPLPTRLPQDLINFDGRKIATGHETQLIWGGCTFLVAEPS